MTVIFALTNQSEFTNGVYTPSTMRVDGVLTVNNNVVGASKYMRQIGNDTGEGLYNDSGNFQDARLNINSKSDARIGLIF